ncbi:hypothetical protein I545_4020 [Mycobacterium kansasii 662]|uniref:Uncharacterized protein n=1 Tax=Mycobacterium kansasii 662 TaxID=1299326 RepID=X7ZCK2_MYCKA|nr:hypothetical protein I545_4020 [Mycobacterium kansasii 662]
MAWLPVQGTAPPTAVALRRSYSAVVAGHVAGEHLIERWCTWLHQGSALADTV